MITNASAIPLCVNVKIASEIELPVTNFNTRVAYVPDTRAHTYGEKTEIDKATVFALKPFTT